MGLSFALGKGVIMTLVYSGTARIQVSSLPTRSHTDKKDY